MREYRIHVDPSFVDAEADQGAAEVARTDAFDFRRAQKLRNCLIRVLDRTSVGGVADLMKNARISARAKFGTPIQYLLDFRSDRDTLRTGFAPSLVALAKSCGVERPPD